MGNLHQPQAGKQQHSVVQMRHGFPNACQWFFRMPPKHEKADVKQQNGNGYKNLVAVFDEQVLHNSFLSVEGMKAAILPQTSISDATFQPPADRATHCGG